MANIDGKNLLSNVFPNCEGWIIKVKKLVFKKATTSLYSMIQQYQVHKIFVFIDFIATQKKKIILGEVIYASFKPVKSVFDATLDLLKLLAPFIFASLTFPPECLYGSGKY